MLCDRWCQGLHVFYQASTSQEESVTVCVGTLKLSHNTSIICCSKLRLWLGRTSMICLHWYLLLQRKQKKKIIPNIKGQRFFTLTKRETINKLKFLEQRLSELGMLTIWTRKEKRQTGDNFKSKLEAPLPFKLMSPCARCFPKKWEEKNKQRRWLVSSSQLICLGNDGEESKPLPAVWSQRIWEKIYQVRSSGYPHCRPHNFGPQCG